MTEKKDGGLLGNLFGQGDDSMLLILFIILILFFSDSFHRDRY